MNKRIEWVLRIAIFGEFLGHGVLALQGKKAWIGWIQDLTNVDSALAAKLLLAIGIFDLIVALLALFRPIRAALLWAVVWGFWTALVRPIVGESVLDFVERWANWGAPLALLLLRGWPKSGKEWFK